MPGTKPTILICDDDKLVRWSLAAYLGRHAFITEQAENGRECLERIEAVQPDLVLLDLKMPVMDGLDCLRYLRERDADLPVIVLTAYGELSSAIEATRLGASHYLTKPADLAEVVETVTRTLEERAIRANPEPEPEAGAVNERYHTMIGG